MSKSDKLPSDVKKAMENIYVTKDGIVYMKNNDGYEEIPNKIKKDKKGREVAYTKIQKIYNGRLYVTECMTGVLVAKAFLPNPTESKRIRFKDGNRCNTNVDNIEWLTNRIPVDEFPSDVKETYTKGIFINHDGDVYVQDKKGQKLKVTKYIKMGRNLCVTLNRRTYSIKRLMAEAFVNNPDPEKYIYVVYLNGRANKVTNIRWVTEEEYKDMVKDTRKTLNNKLCPVCGSNHISKVSFMCSKCRAKQREKEKQEKTEIRRMKYGLTREQLVIIPSLTDKQINIATMFIRGMTTQDIAKKMNVSRQYISETFKIIREKYYKVILKYKAKGLSVETISEGTHIPVKLIEQTFLDIEKWREKQEKKFAKQREKDLEEGKL